MGFSFQEYQSGLPFPSPGDLPEPRIKPMSPALVGRFFTTKPKGTLKNTDMRRDYGLYETKMLLTQKPTGLEAELLSLLTWVHSFNLNSIPSALFLRGCEGFSFKYLRGGKETNKQEQQTLQNLSILCYFRLYFAPSLSVLRYL